MMRKENCIYTMDLVRVRFKYMCARSRFLLSIYIYIYTHIYTVYGVCILLLAKCIFHTLHFLVKISWKRTCVEKIYCNRKFKKREKEKFIFDFFSKSNNGNNIFFFKFSRKSSFVYLILFQILFFFFSNKFQFNFWFRLPFEVCCQQNVVEEIFEFDFLH